MKIPCEDTVTQFLKFGVVGVGNTLLSLAVYYLFIWINPRLYQAGNAVGWVVSVANAFYWNNKYVFYGGAQNKKVLLRQIGKCYLSYGATFLLSAVLLHIETERLRWPETFSPLINLALTIPLNFLLNRYWTFRESGKKPGGLEEKHNTKGAKERETNQ